MPLTSIYKVLRVLDNPENLDAWLGEYLSTPLRMQVVHCTPIPNGFMSQYVKVHIVPILISLILFSHEPHFKNTLKLYYYTYADYYMGNTMSACVGEKPQAFLPREQLKRYWSWTLI